VIQHNVSSAAFDHAGDDKGVLLLHGFSGTPAEVRELGARLHARGYGVVAPTLPGHAGDAKTLHGVSVDDYLRAAETAYADARGRFRRVSVVGFSMGGALGLHLAQREKLDALVIVNTPIEMAGHVRHGVPFVARVAAGAPLPVNPRAFFGHPGYPVVSARAVDAFLGVLARVRDGLSRVACPLLIVQGTRDETVPAFNANAIAAAVGVDAQLVNVPGGPHLLTMGRWLDIIEPTLARFLTDADRGPVRDGRTSAGLS
jgi:carboxylesterase